MGVLFECPLCFRPPLACRVLNPTIVFLILPFCAFTLVRFEIRNEGSLDITLYSEIYKVLHISTRNLYIFGVTSINFV